LTLIVGAVVIAAIAAIWLARSSRDRAFSGPEAVSGELKLPLVAVVPRAHPRSPAPRRRRPRAVLLLGQIVLAVAVFGTVAYAISKPGLIERVCSQSIATLDRAWSSVRQR
jgi:ferric-dicitrate binding protein FerR (iron transport regulator)